MKALSEGQQLATVNLNYEFELSVTEVMLWA